MTSPQYVRLWRKTASPMAEADVTMIPQTYVELTDPQDIKRPEPYPGSAG